MEDKIVIDNHPYVILNRVIYISATIIHYIFILCCRLQTLTSVRQGPMHASSTARTNGEALAVTVILAISYKMGQTVNVSAFSMNTSKLCRHSY